jgi:HEAT repeat protein
VHQRFGNWSPLGQISGLNVMTAMLSQDGPKTWPPSLTRNAGELLSACRDRPELRGSALALAGALLERVPPGQCLDVSRVLAEKGLTDRFPRTRLAAVKLLMRSPLHEEDALLAKVAPMLGDASPVIRRAALVALASARDIVSEDELLPLLHDADFEIQQLCEAALRSRGLGDEHIEMARDISDTSPAARLRVIERIGRARDLDNPTAWLRRLSQDGCAAVRAAAIRAASQHPRVDLGDRLREMAQHDPSETVRQNAQYYLSHGASGR